MRLTWCKVKRDFVPPHEVVRTPVARSDMPLPTMITTDAMDTLQHPATGLHTDSKSAFRQMTRDSGCIEVGNESFAPRKRTPLKEKRSRAEEIKAAFREQGADVL